MGLWIGRRVLSEELNEHLIEMSDNENVKLSLSLIENTFIMADY